MVRITFRNASSHFLDIAETAPPRRQQESQASAGGSMRM